MVSKEMSPIKAAKGSRPTRLDTILLKLMLTGWPRVMENKLVVYTDVAVPTRMQVSMTALQA